MAWLQGFQILARVVSSVRISSEIHTSAVSLPMGPGAIAAGPRFSLLS